MTGDDMKRAPIVSAETPAWLGWAVLAIVVLGVAGFMAAAVALDRWLFP